MLAVVNPFDYFADLNGDALDGGSIFLGQPNQDPEQFPKAIYFDSALTIPAPQPLRTTAGYIVRNGAPVLLFSNGNYSVLVKDKNGSQVYFLPDAQLIGNQSAVSSADLSNNSDVSKGAALVGFDGTNLSAFIKNSLNRVVSSITDLRAVDKTKYTHCFVTGYYAQGDGGGGMYWYDSSDITSVDNAGTVIVASDGGRWKLIHNGVISVKQFGAKGDGATDDVTLINAAIFWSPVGATIFFPSGQYRVSSAVTVTGGITLEGESRTSSVNTFGCAIVGDAAVSPVVKTLAVTTTASATLRNFSITRAGGGTPGTTLVGLETTATDQQVIEDINLWNHGIGLYAHGQLSSYFHRVNTWKCSNYHVKIEACVEPHFYHCRFGRNGNADISSNGYVNIVGTGVDTVRFDSCQFNQSGATAGVIIQFTNFTNPNGMISLIDCHAENWISAGFAADAGSTQVQRLKIVGSTLHQGVAGVQLLSAAAGKFNELIISGSSFDCSATLDTLNLVSVTGNLWTGNSFIVNKGTGSISSNTLSFSSVVAQGVFSHFAFTGNSMPNGFDFSTATGTFTGANNI